MSDHNTSCRVKFSTNLTTSQFPLRSSLIRLETNFPSTSYAQWNVKSAKYNRHKRVVLLSPTVPTETFLVTLDIPGSHRLEQVQELKRKYCKFFMPLQLATVVRCPQMLQRFQISEPASIESGVGRQDVSAMVVQPVSR